METQTLIVALIIAIIIIFMFSMHKERMETRFAKGDTTLRLDQKSRPVNLQPLPVFNAPPVESQAPTVAQWIKKRIPWMN